MRACLRWLHAAQVTSGEIRSDERKVKSFADPAPGRAAPGTEKPQRSVERRYAMSAVFQKHRGHRGTTKSRLSALRSLFDEGRIEKLDDIVGRTPALRQRRHSTCANGKD
jgi:hypothetical protein